MNKVEYSGNEIAVIGMSGRFPRAGNISELWDNLKAGKECITFFSKEELLSAGVDIHEIENPNYIKAHGYLEEAEKFDNDFFGYSNIEALVMDPQIRMLHEVVWEALEDAGYNPETYKKPIGLYVGASDNLYWQIVSSFSKDDSVSQGFGTFLLNNKDFIATQIAYKLNLKGPVIDLSTACSTSLVGIHMACQALLSGECDIALAGGVTISLPLKKGYMYEKDMVMSSDGHCRAFDEAGSGFVEGSGAGVVALKLLEDALNDGDDIYAVIKGSAINNDGNRKVGYTAPSIEGQSEVIRLAHRVAEVEPSTISYIETHGTGTRLGDVVEIEALRQAFGKQEKNYCALGTIKSSVGHLDFAAGVAGFIKTALMLKHKLIPPVVNFNTPNSQLNSENSPFYINKELINWKKEDTQLRAGVSSFGIGGTNAHIVLEEAPETLTEPQQEEKWNVLALSARSPQALDMMTDNLAHYLEANPDANPADVAYTLHSGRKLFKYRRTLVFNGINNAIDALKAKDNRNIKTFYSEKDKKSVIFMFAGQGSQYVSMGLELYEKEPVFRMAFDNCRVLLKGLVEFDIKDVLYPVKENEQEAQQKINQTELTQLVIFVFEYSLTKLLIHWGIKPDAMIGYSFGEYTTALISGVFSLEDALKLIVARGKLMKSLNTGAMLSVPLTETELMPLINEFNYSDTLKVSIAIINGFSCIVSGSSESIDTFDKYMKQKRYLCMKVPVSYAMHSPELAPIVEEFKRKVQSITLNKHSIPYISGLTGTWITGEQVTDPEYWASHLIQPIRFSDGMEKLLEDSDTVFIEVGPGRDLSVLLNRFIEKEPERILNTVRVQHDGKSDIYFLLNKLAQLWRCGIKINWKNFYGAEKRQHINLPTYPFEGKRFWIDSNPKDVVRNERTISLYKKENVAEWFYVPQWVRSTPGYMGKPNSSQWLIFRDTHGISDEIINNFTKKEINVVTVTMGKSYERVDRNRFIIDPAQNGDYERLFSEITATGITIEKIAHFWGVDNIGTEECQMTSFDCAQDTGLYSILKIAKALAKSEMHKEITLDVITNNVHVVSGEETTYPEKATALAASIVIPQEYSYIKSRCIDIVVPEGHKKGRSNLVNQLGAELLSESPDRVIAYRSGFRWVMKYEQIKLEQQVNTEIPFKTQGVYLITGGLGGVGYALAEHIVKEYKAKVVLTGRTVLPEREKWDWWLENHPQEDKISDRIRKILALENYGTDILIFDAADVSDEDKMKYIVDRAEEEFGAITGVIHSAGVLDGSSFSLINDLDLAECKTQFNSKVYGLLVLERIFRDKETDFCVLMSSIASVLGGLGHVAYSAANLFMDYFVQKINSFGDKNWKSVCWSEWQKDNGSNEKITIGATIAELSMSTDEAIDAFERILAFGGQGQIVCSPGDLQQRLNQWVKPNYTDSEESEKSGNIHKTYYTRPSLSNSYVEPQSQIEKELADTWKDLFRISEVGILDDFFELGGDSLKAITVINNIYKKFEVELPLTDFFKFSTIEKLGAYLTASDKKAYIPINKVEEKEYYALSSAQKRLYFINQYDPSLTTYNMSGIFVLEGDIDKIHFEKVFNCLIERHDSLRTSFVMKESEPVQIIHNHIDFKIEFHECNENQVDNIIDEFIKPFDLSKAPLIRVALIRLTDGKYIFIYDMHHIISDGVSMNVLINDFISLYNGEQLKPLKMQYRDFSEWQNNLYKENVDDAQEKYWLNRFSGEIPVLNMPTDYNRPAVQSYEGAHTYFVLDKSRTGKLNDLAAENGVTLFMVLLAAYNVLLNRYTGQEEIIIGTPVAGRQHADLQDIIGVFVNTLPLLNHPKGSKSFVQFLEEVKQSTLEAFDNQSYQFEQLVDKLNIPKDISRNPLFDTMLVLQNTGNMLDTLNASGKLRFSEYNHKNNMSKFDIMLTAFEDKGEITFEFEYSTMLFKQDTIDNLSKHFINILEDICDAPHKELREIKILSKEEQDIITNTFNATACDYIKDKNVIDVFEENAALIPQNIAVIYNDKSWTYAELNERSNQLAHYLKSLGIGNDTIVGLMVRRSFEMMVGIYAILKAGGAYLPIDPEYPEARIDYMIKDSGIEYILTDRNTVASPDIKGKIVYLDDDYSKESKTNPVNITQPNSLAYVIYTSGSTGNPKGAMIEHTSLMNRLIWMQKNTPINQGDVVLQKTTFSFDVSVWELLWWGMQGAVVCLLENEGEKNPLSIVEAIYNNKVTILHFVPSMFSAFLSYLDTCSEAYKLNSLKYIITSGEALTLDMVNTFNYIFKNNTGVRLVNLYGPTEATIDVSYFNCPRDTTGIQSIPIGKPIDNIRLYITNKDGRLQPMGVPGELCIGGVGLARGYLNKELLTNEKFIFNPFLNGERLYKTGDLAKWNEDGNIEYLGRIDNQVKIRGFRIELGEIEGALRKIDGITDSVVIDVDDETGKSLCAYIVTGKEISPNNLRTALGNVLPDYMVPSYYVAIEKIPLTANGKLDRKALPKPNKVLVRKTYVPPENNTQMVLCQIWGDVLGIDRVGTLDNFFEIGGDSIKALQILARLYQHGLQFTIKNLFKYPNVKELSSHVKYIVYEKGKGFEAGELPLTPIQKLFFEKSGEQNHHFNQSVMIFNKDGFSVEVLKNALNGIIKHHDAIRMVYNMQGNKIIQYNNDESANLYDFYEYTLNDSEYIKTIEEQCEFLQSSINLSTGPLVKVGLFHTLAGEYLAIIIHHLVVDGVSWRILLEDLKLAYDQSLKGNKIVLPSKTASFQQWAKELKGHADSESVYKNIQYWRDILNVSVPKLPRDYKISEIRKNKYREAVSITFTSDETNDLLKNIHNTYHTKIEDILLAGLGMALKSWNGNDKALIALEGHGREELLQGLPIARTVGWFTSLYPVLLDMGSVNKLSYYLRMIKENLRKIPNGGIEFGLYQYIRNRGEEEQSFESLEPEIMFNYLGQFDKELVSDYFEVAQQSCGKEVSPEGTPWYALDINCITIDGALKVTASFDKNEYKSETISNLMEAYKACLQEIILHCKTQKQELGSPADFKLDMPLESFDKLTESLYSNIKWSNEKERIIQDIYKLSPMQEGILFHAVSSDSETYFQQCAFDISGKLEIDLLEKCLNEIVERYDILRTVFVYEGLSNPLQVVLKERMISVLYEDISAMDDHRKHEYYKAFKKLERETGFDVTRDSLIKMSVLYWGDGQYKLIWSFHHILMDGWCLSILFGELLKRYTCFCGKTKLEFPQVTSYRNYIEWLQKNDENSALQYWGEYLQDYNTQALLPQKNKREDQSYRQMQFNMNLDEECVRKIEDISKRYHVTQNTVMQSVWGILLQKYTGNEDVVFGAVVSGRPAEIENIENMLGLFINTIPVRISTQAQTKFSELVMSRQDEALESDQHSYISLSKVQAVSELKQGLFDHIIIYENYPLGQNASEAAGYDSTGFIVEGVEAFEQTNYDLNIIVNSANGIEIDFRYNANVYEEWLIEQLARHLETIIKQVSDNFEITIEDIDLLLEEERQQLLCGFNDTYCDYSRGDTIIDLFEKQVGLTPDDTALIFHNEILTYRELNERSNRLAHYLRRLGFKPNMVAGIMVKRSFDMMIAIVGILKAGGAYLPIDPELPEERISYMMEDCDGKFLLVDKQKSISQDFKGQVININESEKEPNYNPEKVNLPSDLAYVIYTSGSTGKPKGVMIEHRAVNNFITGMSRKIDFSSGKTILALTTISFDIFVLETILALTKGLKVVIADEQSQKDIGMICELIRKNNIDMVQMTPSRAQLFLSDKKWSNYLISLKEIIIGGEPFTENLLGYLEGFKGVKVYNVYGPTETTVWSTIKELTGQKQVNIGNPIANTQIYILNSKKQLVPKGVKGELYIGGDGLARGYISNNKLTEEKFIQNPFNPNERIYKTGDISKWLYNGEIQCYGRMDHQIKIMGYRIELGEIEHQISKHELVADVVVSKITTLSNTDSLVSFIVVKDEGQKEELINSLNEFLSHSLPAYMIPSKNIVIDSIPRLINGKTDYRALNEIANDFKDVDKKKLPRDEVEQKIYEIWASILGTSQFDIETSFFYLGGNSLNLMKLVSDLNTAFNVSIPLGTLFTNNTIEMQSAIVKKWSPDGSDNIILPSENREYYPLSFLQKGFYILDLLYKDNTMYNISEIVELEGDLDISLIQSIFNNLIERHESLRTAFISVDGVPVQKIMDKVDFQIEFIEKGSENIESTLQKLIRPFNLSKPPLIRVGIVKLENKRHLLVIDMHHIITDAISIGIIIRDFLSIYQQKELPKLKLQYKDYAVWQESSIFQDKLKKQEAYWLSRFKGVIPQLDLPIDFERPPVQTYGGASVAFELDKEEVSLLRKLCVDLDSTLYTVLLTVFNVFLYKITGQTDIILGTPVSGRTSGDVEHLVGMFVNTVILRNKLERTQSFEEVFSEIKLNTVTAFSNQDYPFNELVKRVCSKRDLSRNPIFNVMFQLQDFEVPRVRVDGLKIKPFERSINSNFDMTFSITDTGETIKVAIIYNISLFKSETVEKWKTYFIGILNRILADRTIKLTDIQGFKDDKGFEDLKSIESDFEVPFAIDIDFDFDN